MANQKNPWNRARLLEYLDREEDHQFEVKSSRDLADGDKGKMEGFFQKKVARTISAFLNSDGGLFVIGMEEGKAGQNDIATELSPGVPRSVMTAKQVQDKVFGLISPPSADLVRVYPIDLEKEVPLLAFAIDVRAGNTAYQSSPDKVYYVRRGSSSDPMDDKDIRLRMLADDKPRVTLSIRVTADKEMASMAAEAQRLAEKVAEWESKKIAFLSSFKGSEDERLRALAVRVGFRPQPLMLPSWRLSFDIKMKNTGYVTIREFATHAVAIGNEYAQTTVGGLSPDLDNGMQHWVLDGEDENTIPLFPDGEGLLPAPQLTVSTDIDLSKATIQLRCRVLLNNGRPCEIAEDVTQGFADCRHELGELAAGTSRGTAQPNAER